MSRERAIQRAPRRVSFTRRPRLGRIGIAVEFGARTVDCGVKCFAALARLSAAEVTVDSTFTSSRGRLRFFASRELSSSDERDVARCVVRRAEGTGTILPRSAEKPANAVQREHLERLFWSERREDPRQAKRRATGFCRPWAAHEEKVVTTNTPPHRPGIVRNDGGFG